MNEFSIDFWSILVLIAVAQAVLFSIIFGITKRGNRLANILMSSMIVFLIWLLLEFVSIRMAVPIDTRLFYGSRHGVWLLIGPLLYLYGKALTVGGFMLRTKDITHFLPFILFTMVLPLFVQEPVHSWAVHYGILIFASLNLPDLTFIQRMYHGIFIAQFIHALVYVMLTLQVLNHHINKVKGRFSSIDKISLRWLRHIIIGFAGVLGLSILFFFILFQTGTYSRVMDYIYILPLTIMVIVIGFRMMKEPELYAGYIGEIQLAEGNKKYEKSSLTAEVAHQGLEKLLSYMTTEQPFRNSNLKLQALAESLDIHPHHLSQIINEHVESSFFDFVNEYRIEYAKESLKEKTTAKQSILEVAFEAGFNNVTSFNRYFKKYTGTTPSRYRSQFK